MVVTATEFKQNLGKYIELSQQERIVITKNGKPYSYLIGRPQWQLESLEKLTGIIKDFKPTQEELDADPRLARIMSR